MRRGSGSQADQGEVPDDCLGLEKRIHAELVIVRRSFSMYLTLGLSPLFGGVSKSIWILVPG